MAKEKLSDKGKLNDYSAKRAFDITPEPAAAVPQTRSGPLLFVIQQHSATRLHYDFRLECDGVLKSWAVPKGPSLDPAEKRLAVQTEDHPFDYASFEGVIPPGQYGAGEVIVWDCGVYSPDEEETWFHDRDEAQRQVLADLDKGKLSVLLRGEKVKGSFALVRTSDAKNWLLIKHKDRFVAKTDLTEQNRSVLSGAAVEDMKIVPAHQMPAARLVPGGKSEPMPASLAPMHAELGDAAFNHDDWMWEPKLDGYRVLAFIDEEKVQLRSRRGLELAAEFPQLAAELAKQAAPMILDGEIVAFDAGGKPSFNALQNRAPTVVFYAFDLLYFAGVDLRKTPYRDRRRYLAQCLLPSPLVKLVHATEDGEALQRAAAASGLEGVIGKRKDSNYEAGRRSSSWLKIKSTDSAEFVIGGYTKGKGSREPLGALLVGYWDDSKLRYASHVGSGFDADMLTQVKARLDPLRTPVFLRLREDLDPRGVQRREGRAADAPTRKSSTSSEIEEVLKQLENQKAAFTLALGPHQIRLTHLDRVYWPADPALKQPALTKRDLLRYLAQVSSFIVPHLVDRPLTMIRMPDGIHGQRFFQKHWSQERPPFVEMITVFSDHKDESHEYLLCN